VTADEVAVFARCLGAGGVGLFPADTVYGLAADAESADGVRRLYEIKRRPPMPSAVMFLSLELALAALPLVGPRTRAAFERLLPGPLTLIVSNPQGLFPLACGDRSDRLGVRVPALTGALTPLQAVERPLIQSSANLHGGSDARRLADVPAEVRTAVDVELDGGDLPGTASTVVDVSSYEDDGTCSILREGAVTRADLERSLS